MQFHHIIGIDVSKNTLDAICHHTQSHEQFTNTKKGYSQLLKWVKQQTKELPNEVLFCFEHTGLYSLVLAMFLEKRSITYAMVPGLAIKRSVGIVRGKSDKIDARQIARYAWLHRQELKTTKLPSENLLQLKMLLGLRERLIEQRAGYRKSLKEAKLFLKKVKTLFEVQEKMIAEFNKQIKKVEQQMDSLIQGDEQLKEYFELMLSIRSVGKVLAYYMLVYTQAFTRFTNWRSFACYCGVAPFEHTSGISIRGKTHVNHLANRRVKAVLHMAAMSSITNNKEIQIYYKRRTEEGKNKMSTLNIIRNKLLSRIFAVVKRKTPYVQLANFAA
jgi:transposase